MYVVGFLVLFLNFVGLVKLPKLVKLGSSWEQLLPCYHFISENIWPGLQLWHICALTFKHFLSFSFFLLTNVHF